MKRTVFLILLLAVSGGIAGAQGMPGGDAGELLNRLASLDGAVNAKVLVGALPAEMPQVPLPAGHVVGSVRQSFGPGGMRGDAVQIYYDADPSAFENYGTALRAAGWKPARMPFRRSGGFLNAEMPVFAMYCSASGAQTVTESLAPNRRDLRVSIQQRMAAGSPSPCDPAFGEAMLEQLRTPLPDLAAPAGTQMAVSQAGNPAGASGAYITGGKTAEGVADAFAAQFIAGGWTHSGTAQSAGIASQSFHKLDELHNAWQAVITVYAVDAKPGDFIAFVDATNLSKIGAARNRESEIAPGSSHS